MIAAANSALGTWNLELCRPCPNSIISATASPGSKSWSKANSHEPIASPLTRILGVKVSGSTGTLQDWNGTTYVDAPLAAGVPTSEREVAVQPAGTDFAIWRPPANRYELLPTTFRVVRFQLPAALTTSDAVMTGCPVIRIAAGANPGTTVDVRNDDGWESDAGSQGWAFYDNSTGAWVIFVLPCPAGSS